MNWRSERGFTLIELLVAITVLALLMVLLFGGLRFGARAWERGNRVSDSTSDVRAVQTFLRGTIGRVCPRRIKRTSDAPSKIEFTGDPRSMEFLAPVPQSLGAGDCEHMAIDAGVPGWNTDLVWISSRGDAGTMRLLKRTLVKSASSISFSYFGDGAWQDSWKGRSALPALVRIRMTFPKGDSRVWPELFIALRISAEADCVYDTETHTCRDP